MLVLVKVIGAMSTVAIPAGVCGVQVFLTKQQQTEQVKKINEEITKTNSALKQASENYTKEIARIQTEKNELLTTKTNLTYVPVDVQQQIQKLNGAKTSYESAHADVQNSIKSAITAHAAAVGKAKTAIESLWTTEKARVERIQAKLDQEITAAKEKNTSLISEIDELKSSIYTTINQVFYTAP